MCRGGPSGSIEVEFLLRAAQEALAGAAIVGVQFFSLQCAN
jgi:hypothetical protein